LKVLIKIIFLLFIFHTAFSQTQPVSYEKITDTRDSITYKIAKIRNQTWMAENLKYATGKGSWCYENKKINCEKYGRLYDWNTAKKACPEGWHLPSNDEWNILVSFVDKDGGGGSKLKSTTGWDSNGNGTNNYGFTALPGGYRGSNGIYKLIGSSGLWWSSTDEYNKGIWYGNVYLIDSNLSSYLDLELYGFNVRCVKNN